MTEKHGVFQRMRSLRAMIAVGGVAAAAIGITQATGTMANPDQSVETTSAVTTGNFYPTPLTASVKCSTIDGPWNNIIAGRRAEITWDAVPGATGYLIEFVDRGTGQVRRTEERSANDRKVSGVTATNPRGDGLYARVYTKNGPVTSTGYTVSDKGMSHKDLVSSRTECEGSTGVDQPNQPWEDQRTWGPSLGIPGDTQGRPAPAMMAAPSSPETSAESTTEAPEPTTESPESSTPESSVTTTPEETTSTEPTTTPESSTTEPTTPSPTEDPKPVLVETVPNGAVTAGWTQGYTRVVVVDGDGAELAGGRVEEGSTLHWLNDELWILGPTENFRIMRGTDGDWRFYTDGGDIPRELRGN